MRPLVEVVTRKNHSAGLVADLPEIGRFCIGRKNLARCVLYRAERVRAVNCFCGVFACNPDGVKWSTAIRIHDYTKKLENAPRKPLKYFRLYRAQKDAATLLLLF